MVPDVVGWWWSEDPSFGGQRFALLVLDSGLGLVAEVGAQRIPVERMTGWLGRVPPPGAVSEEEHVRAVESAYREACKGDGPSAWLNSLARYYLHERFPALAGGGVR